MREPSDSAASGAEILDAAGVECAWRPRDRNDIASILETATPIDEGYVEEWAARWEVSDRWAEARASR